MTDALIAVEYYRDPITGIGYPVLSGYALLETYLQYGMDGHPREGFVEDVYQHREDAIALLEEFRPSVVHTQQQLADGNGMVVLAALSGGGLVALAPRVAAACLTNPTCRAGAAGFEVAGGVTDMTACANDDGLACSAAFVPVVTTGGLGDDLVDLGADVRRGDGVVPDSNGGTRPNFYVSPNGEAVEGTLYRYSDSTYADDILQNFGSPAIDGRGHYLGTEALDSASSVRDRYQIAPEWSNPTVRGELDSMQLYDPNTSTRRLRTPTSNGNTTTIPEPYTSAYPEYGTGGARQYITDPKTSLRYDNVDIIGD